MDKDLITKLTKLAGMLDEISDDLRDLMSPDNLPVADSFIAGAQGETNQASDSVWEAIEALKG